MIFALCELPAGGTKNKRNKLGDEGQGTVSWNLFSEEEETATELRAYANLTGHSEVGPAMCLSQKPLVP